MSSKLQGKGPKTLETHLALVVRRVDKAIQQIAWFVGVCWIVIYPVDSVIQPSNNSGLKGEGSHPIFFQRMEPKSWFCVVERPSKVLEVLAQKRVRTLTHSQRGDVQRTTLRVVLVQNTLSLFHVVITLQVKLP